MRIENGVEEVSKRGEMCVCVCGMGGVEWVGGGGGGGGVWRGVGEGDKTREEMVIPIVTIVTEYIPLECNSKDMFVSRNCPLWA